MAVETQNIREELVNYSTGKDPSFVDFDIIDTKIILTPNGIESIYYVEFFDRQPNILCKVTDIEIDKTTQEKKAFLRVNCSQLAEPINIDTDAIIKVINKKLALHSIVHGVVNLELVAKAIEKRLNLKNNFKVLVAEGTQALNGQDAQLNTFFELNTVGKIDEKGNINFKEKSFAVEIDVGTVIAEYIKPTKGTDGMDIFGSTIKARDGADINVKAVKINESVVNKIEDDIAVRFVSKRSGSLVFKDGIFDIAENVKIDRVTLKTGNINLKNSQSIVIGNSGNVVDDVVADGMKVIGKKVIINGNVGPEAYIEADEVNIKGSVHIDATIKAKTATIKNLSGTLIAEEAYVENATHANINIANKIVVDNCFSANIKSRVAELKKVLNNNIIICTNELIIHSAKGANNKFSIKHSDEYKALMLEQKEIIKQLMSQKEEIDVIKNRIDLNARKCSEAVNLVKRLRNNGSVIPPALINNIENYKQLLKKHKDLLQKIGYIEKTYEINQMALKEQEELFKKACIIVKGEIAPDNLIEFDNIAPHRLLIPQYNVKIYAREINDSNEVVIVKIDN